MRAYQLELFRVRLTRIRQIIYEELKRLDFSRKQRS